MNKLFSRLFNIFAVLIIATSSIYRSGWVVEGDIFWQTRAGIDWLKYFKIIKIDEWSYLPNGEWIPNSWGWNVVLAFFYQLSNPYGLFILGVLLSSLLLTIIYFSAKKLSIRSDFILLSLITALIFSLNILSLRPALISGLALICFIYFIENFSSKANKFPLRSFGFFFLFNVIMINMHLSWPAYLVPLLIAISASLYEKMPRNEWLKKISLYAFVALLALLFNPVGVKLFSHILFTVNNSVGVIYEWRPVWKAPIYFFPIILSFFVFWKLHQFSKLRIWLLCSIYFSLLGIYAVRFAPWAMLFLTPPMSFWISSLSYPSWWKKRQLFYTSVIATVFLFFIVNLVPRSLKQHGEPNQLESIKLLPKNCHLLSSDVLSSPVVLYRPDVKIFIDGRNDYWGRQRVLDVSNLITNPNKSLLDQNNPTCIMSFKNGALSRYLLTRSDWKLIEQVNPSTLEIWSKENTN